MATPQGLPRETFAKLSPHPYLLSNLRAQGTSPTPKRINNRAPQETRVPNVNTSPLTHAHGSALVRVGDNTVICGVRGEILPTANIPNYRASNRDSTSVSELKEYDLVVPNIELATGSAPQFLPGAPPTTLAQTLSTRVYSLLHSSGLLNVDDLRIWDTKPSEIEDAAPHEDEDAMMTEEAGDDLYSNKVVIGYWVLYIDIFFLSYDGNPFDIAWAAMLAALRNTKLPAARWDLDREMVICSRKESKGLDLNGFPIPCTAAIFTDAQKESATTTASGEFYGLVDPDRLEEKLCDETITIVVDKSAEEDETKILTISKHGGLVLQPKLIRQFVGVAEKRWDEFNKAMA